MQRWAEEISLLQEEMRRVLVYCEKHAVWWDNRSSSRTNQTFLDLQDGTRAYALKQASILRNRAKVFAKMWSSLGAASEVEPDMDAEGENDVEDE
jgi:hypothetical protein